MTIRDRLKLIWQAATFRPRKASGSRRGRYRPRGRYEGARRSDQRSFLDSSLQGARLDISTTEREELVRRARYWEKNSTLVQRQASVFESYVVGRGLIVQPNSEDPEWNERAAEAWNQWGRVCDLTSLQPLASLQSQIARAWFIDGECFINKTRGKTKEGNRPRIQVIEAHSIATPDELLNDPQVFDGVRFDERGRPVGYYHIPEDAQGMPRGYQLLNAANVEHVFEPDRPLQARGIPFLSSSLNTLHDLSDIAMLEMQAAKANAAIAHIVKNAEGEADPEELRRQGFTEDVENSDGTTSEETRADYFEDVLGSEAVYMREGEDLQMWKSERPSVVTMEYLEKLEAAVCMGTGLDYVIVKPASMQGTVFRGAIAMADAYFRARTLVLEAILRSLWVFWLQWERFTNPDLASLPRNWQRVTIIPPRSINVDVGRNAAAEKIGLETGTTTFDEIYGARGYDWRERFDTYAQQIEYARKKGIPLSFAQQQMAPVIDNQQSKENGKG